MLRRGRTTEDCNIDGDTPVLLRGRLSNYRKTRDTRDFLFDDVQRQLAGLTALAAATAGSGGAIGLTALSSAKEQADRVEFTLNDQKVSGWLMWSPFNEGDEVEVAADRTEDGYRAYAVLRPSDRTIALYPHCSRGRIAHFSASIKWYSIIYMTMLVLVAMLGLLGSLIEPMSWPLYFEVLLFGGIGGFFFWGIFAFHFAWRFMPFVRMAEGVFRALGWEDVKNIDLPARSRKQRKPGDSPGLGTLYFRY